MVSEMTFAFEVLFQLQLEFRMLMASGILFQMCESLVYLDKQIKSNSVEEVGLH